MVVMSMDAYEEWNYENEVYEKLREAEIEAASTTKRLTHEQVMEAAWARIRAAKRKANA